MFGCCKTFSGKYIFSGNANFQKRKIFLYVWLHFKKFSGKYFLVFGKEEGKHKSRKTQATTQKKIINDDRRSRSTARSRSRLLCEIAIDGAILRSVDRDLESSSLAVDRDLATARSQSTTRSRRPTLLLSRARVLSLSLSLIFQKCFEGKIEV